MHGAERINRNVDILVLSETKLDESEGIEDIEGIFVELTVPKKKGLLSCSYKPSTSTITDHLQILRSKIFMRFIFCTVWE